MVLVTTRLISRPVQSLAQFHGALTIQPNLRAMYESRTARSLLLHRHRHLFPFPDTAI